MTDWPLLCDECGTEVYVGTLYGGMCSDCHMEATLEKLAGDSNTGQSALGDFA